MCCGTVTRKLGRVGLGYLLNDFGMIKSEATFANLPGRIWYGSAAAAEYHDMDWLSAHIRPDEDVSIRSLTNDWTILVIAGPRARDVLSGASRGDWSADAFPWLSVREATVGTAPAVVMVVSFSGELAYEIHVPNAQLLSAYEALRSAGDRFGMHLFGSRAVESMRLEKGFLHWKGDLLTEIDPYEAGLGRFVREEKVDFVGKETLQKRRAQGPSKCLVTLVLDCDERSAQPGASVMVDEEIVGAVTSGAWGYRTEMNLALAYVSPEFATRGATVQCDLLGDLIAAQVIESGPYDPDFQRVRS